MPALPDEENDKRWSVKGEMSKLIKTAIEHGFDDQSHEVPCIQNLTKKTLGDYECNTVVRIWYNLKKKYHNFSGLKHIAQVIKNNIPPNDMIDECIIHNIGFLTFKLSKTWIAKSLLKMLNEGIHVWAPKFPMKKAIIDFSSQNIAGEMDVGRLRSTIVGDTLARILEYSKVAVIRRDYIWDQFGDCATQYGMLIEILFERFPNGEINNFTIGELEVLYKESKKRFDEDADFKRRAQVAAKCFKEGNVSLRHAYEQICEINRKGYEKVYKRLGVHVDEERSTFSDYISRTLRLLREKGLIEKSEGEEVIYIEGKKKPLTLVRRDGNFDDALIDLAKLWYGINEEEADWMVYVTDIGKREYNETCFTIARQAGWLPTDENEYPRTKHVGVGLIQTCSTEAVKLVDFLDQAKTLCIKALVEQGKASEWTGKELEDTAEALGYGAVKYSDLKKVRTFNYSLNFDEMLNHKGNTAVNLLYAHAEICSIISGKDIGELKKTGELLLEIDEERDLGLHLVRFTEIIEFACTNVLPDILCIYLHRLSEKFTIFNSLEVVGSAKEASRLLMCEATRVVMKKCFELLGITPVFNI